MRFATARTIVMCAVATIGAGLAALAADAPAPAPAPAEQAAPAAPVGQATDVMVYIQACQGEVTNLTRAELDQRAQNMTNQQLLAAAYKRIKELEDAAKASQPVSGAALNKTK